jgi:5-methylcytosine-specific restriction endonuclease McrA
MRDERGRFISGHKHTEEVKEKIRNIHKGKPAKWIISGDYAEICEKISNKKKGLPHINQRGENNWRWKGGITPINLQVRHSIEYKNWRRAVFERDGYMCVIGGKEHGNKLQADHIQPFSLYPELRFDLDNGRTLCEECHRKIGYKGLGRPKKELQHG